MEIFFVEIIVVGEWVVIIIGMLLFLIIFFFRIEIIFFVIDGCKVVLGLLINNKLGFFLELWVL